MIESRTESLVHKLNTQREKRAAVRPSPLKSLPITADLLAWDGPGSIRESPPLFENQIMAYARSTMYQKAPFC